ncbi:uncharacterized protein RJT20DRAFT_130614 [Scheffersomyces xylosifermentans]|uniref:uncharacterized protein n=1 Tax=Scheffersomyces xylosifermentans TaxID=1304137 RepID=UPI00315DD65B
MATMEEDSVYIPIPHYPPFKLRSSLIDKDPVIWVHLLEAYIQLFIYLLDPSSAKLSVKSQQQLQLFLKVYLFETSEEATKIFSLGAINPDIKSNTALLRSYVFQLIKSFSVVKFNLPGEAVWNFVTIYVKQNATIVRGLVDGSFKSKLNDNKKSGNISSIGPLQRHLESLISNGKFGHQDLDTLSLLLGQHTSNVTSTTTISLAGSTRTKNVSKKASSSLQFSENFVNQEWIETLEKLYVNGKSVHAETIKDVMVISLISLSTAKVSKLAMELGVTGVKALSLYPLFSTLIISEAYKELVPNLEERLPFLRTIAFNGEEEEDEPDIPVQEEHMFMLVDLFQNLSLEKAKIILQRNGDNIESVTNMLLENPDLIDTIPEKVTKKVKTKANKKPTTTINLPKSKKKAVEVPKRSVYDDDEISRGDFSKSTVIFGKKAAQGVEPTSEEYKKKTLSAALRLMYESDEDEPDDTYDDQEKTVGSALEDASNRKKLGKGNLSVFENEEKKESSPSPVASAVDKKESYLFSIFKTKGPEAFDKSSRKSAERSALKKETNWSDEQIEGWLRMLLKSPRRFKILEENFFYGGNPNRPSKKLNESRESTPQPESSPSSSSSSRSDTPKQQTSQPKEQNAQQSKRTQARNEKNKASRANHNRKSQHNKKARSELAGLQ